MSKRELERAGVLARVKAGQLRISDCAVLMRVSYRQAKRLWKRYQIGGAARLKHGNAGRISNRRRSEKERQKILRKIQRLRADTGQRAAGQ